MQIVPVIDVCGGTVVRAVGGNRANYRPWVSELCPTGEPLPMAFALREKFHFEQVYVADLAALDGATPDWELFAGLTEIGLEPWVDCGVHDAINALRLRTCGAAVVVGSESLTTPESWERIVREVDERRLIFSLDLRDGKLIGAPFGEYDPIQLMERVFAVAQEVRAFGPSRLIVLDVARVGRNNGPGTEPLIERLAKKYPDCDVFAGGGVRGENDLRRLEGLGAAGVLVASALHEGKIQPRRHS